MNPKLGQRMRERFWVTAKGLRALGYPMPPEVPDEEVIDYREEPAP